MNADAMAEKRPAYGTSQPVLSTGDDTATYEYQRCVQIIIVFLYKVLVMFFGHLMVVLIKLSSEVF